MQRFVNPRARARTATNDFGATFTDSPVRVARGKRREKNSRRSSLLAFIYKASQVQVPGTVQSDNKYSSACFYSQTVIIVIQIKSNII